MARVILEQSQLDIARKAFKEEFIRIAQEEPIQSTNQAEQDNLSRQLWRKGAEALLESLTEEQLRSLLGGKSNMGERITLASWLLFEIMDVDTHPDVVAAAQILDGEPNAMEYVRRLRRGRGKK